MKLLLKNILARTIGYAPYIILFYFIYQIAIFREMILVNTMLQLLLATTQKTPIPIISMF